MVLAQSFAQGAECFCCSRLDHEPWINRLCSISVRTLNDPRIGIIDLVVEGRSTPGCLTICGWGEQKGLTESLHQLAHPRRHIRTGTCSVPVCLGLRGFWGHRTFSAETRNFPGKLEQAGQFMPEAAAALKKIPTPRLYPRPI